jgi:hypothetical protein
MPPPFPWRAALLATATYTAAFLLTVLLHELGHALVSKALGGQPVLHHTFVENRTSPLAPRTEVAIALAGPLLSLTQGVLCLQAAARRADTGLAALFGLYLGLFGLLNFLGYLLTGPFVAYGDIGRAEALLQLPTWATWLVAAAAAVSLHGLVGRTGPLFLRFGPGLARPARGRLLQALIALPWLLGSLLLTLLSWPWPTLLSVLYPPLSSMALGAAYGRAMRQAYPVAEAAPNRSPLWPTRHGWKPLLALLVLAGIYRALVGGVAL